MELRQLRYFVQIVESGSLSRAAEMLRIAQPSLSLQVKSLEEELGIALLVRHPRGVTPTELGMVFCNHARKVLSEVEQAKDVVRSQAASPVGRVSVGLPTSACRGLSLPLVRAVAQRHPRISLHIVEAMTGSLDEWIQMGRLDVALLYNHRAYEHVAWTEMMSEDLMLIVPNAAAGAPRGPVPFQALSRLPLTLPSRLNVLRAVVEQIAARHEVELTVDDCDSLPCIRQLVLAGAMTIMPQFAFAEEIARGEMRALAIDDPTPSWTLSVVLSQRTINLRASQVVAEIMAEVIADLVGSGTWTARLKAAGRGPARA